MDALSRVTFRFDDEMEISYVAALPNPGDVVTHRRAIWVVAQVVPDDGDGKIVMCRPLEDERVRPVQG